MTVECARCGQEYENPNVTSQLDADGKLEVCGPCWRDLGAEIEEAERGR